MTPDAPGVDAPRPSKRPPDPTSGPLGGPGTTLGQGRFVLKGVLGSGSSGVVYAAHDRVRDAAVALKTLHRLDAQSIYHLKREFRALADLSHPNLVPLHELVFDDDRWFFTMELIDGVDLLTHVRGGDDDGRRPGETFRPDIVRLREALRQLAAGVQALHRSRKLHRDIKPSNARVTAEGRLVLLDFGLVVAAEDPYRTADAGPVGTPAYLAPEQAGNPPKTSQASDWYAMGVLLYEALTGSLPFDGTVLKILAAKQAGEPPPPSELVPWVPPDLDRLCVQLLRREPEARPSGRDVLRALESGSEAFPPVAEPPGIAVESAPVLLGRDREMEALRDAFVACKRGKTLTVFVHGESGAGKTTLVDAFLEQLRVERDAVVISGRCVERELVPYRALDSLVDGLTRYLMSLSMRDAEAVLPRDISVLARLFPVLRRVPAVGGGLRRDEVVLEPHELRSRAFAALRDLAGRIADRRPLVLAIDDLQWGDVDSAHLIRYVVRPPNPPPLLAIACFRTGDPARSACLQALLEPAAPGTRSMNEVREIALPPLGHDDSRRLAQSLFTKDVAAGDAAATRVARESAGNPYFIQQLAQFLNSGQLLNRHGSSTGTDGVGADAVEVSPAVEVSLEQVLGLRVAELPEAARHFLEVLALAGVPLEPELANVVADLSPGDHGPLTTLRADRMVRPHDQLHGDVRTVEITHDRLRQAVLRTLAPAAKTRIHARLARAFESRPDIDPEILASHFEGAGDRVRASAYAAVATQRAEEALAFDRAVRMARWALELGPEQPEEIRRLQTRLGQALANMGNAAEAADAYLQACPGARETEALELRRRAAEQLLKSGHIDRAMSILDDVLRSVGLRLARTPRKAWFSLSRRRLWLGVRGLSFRERDSTHISVHDRTKLDVLWSLSAGLGIVDSIRAADFQARHLILALRLGDAYRVGRALTFEASFSATAGPSTRKRTQKMVRKSEEIAARLDVPDSRAWALLAAGMAAFLQGDHRDSVSLCERAETIFRTQCVGVAWEVNCARLFSLFSLYYQGEIGELSRRVPALLIEAEQHGDLYLATCLRMGIPNVAWLAADEPEQARAQVAEGMRHWSKHGFHNQHYFYMAAEANIDLYVGDPAAARARVLADWPKLKSSLILRIQAIRQLVMGLRARATLALAMHTSSQGTTARERDALLAAVERDARRLSRESIAWAPPQAQLLRAGVAQARGRTAEAITLLTEAAAGFAAADMRLFHFAATRCLGRLRGGSEGAHAVARAEAWMSAQSIKRPERFTAVFAPGFEDPPSRETP